MDTQIRGKSPHKPAMNAQQSTDEVHAESSLKHDSIGMPWRTVREEFGAPEEMMLLGYPAMSAAWRLFLFGNGSPTHHLALLTGSPTAVDVIGMEAIGEDGDGAPVHIDAIATPRSRRQVWLRNDRNERLGYAVSWIHDADIEMVFRNQKLPIGKNILQNKTELFRDMKRVYCVHSPELAKAFGHPGPFWGRSYLFWRGGRPVTFIYEVFSPTLEQYMGPVLQGDQ